MRLLDHANDESEISFLNRPSGGPGWYTGWHNVRVQGTMEHRV